MRTEQAHGYHDQSATTCCPTCGAQFGELPNWSRADRLFSFRGKAVGFTNREATVVDAVWRARLTGGISGRERLLQIAYADCRDGGPLVDSVMSIHLAAIRVKLATVGFTITYAMGRPRSSYRLIEIAKPTLRAVPA